MAKTNITCQDSTRKQKTMPIEQNTSPEVKIAVLNNDIKHINDTLARMEQKFDLAISNFVTIDKLNDVIQDSNHAHKSINDRLKKIERWFDRVVWLILSAVILAVLGGVLITQ